MTELIIIRHAQSLANANEVFIGQTDLGLSEMGKKQAEALCLYLQNIKLKVDKIYSSSLSRPYQTIEPYAKAVGKEIIKRDGLREIYAGKWENNKFADLPDLFPETFAHYWKEDIANCTPDGGESVAALYERVNLELDTLACENDGKRIIISTHATPIRCFCARAVGGLSNMQQIKWVNNASVNIFNWENGILSAVSINNHDFLAGIDSSLPKTV